MASSETQITSAQFQKLSRIVYDESGIVINDKKYNLLLARLSKRMRRTRTASVSDYIKLISNSKAEFDEFIDAVTTNHTFFFRENRHCEYIINKLDRTKSLKIWCSAASSGEEPYSIAVQLLQHNFTFTIFASDISGEMLEKCRKGIYPVDRTKYVPVPILHNYFQKGSGRWRDHVKIKQQVMKHVQFGRFNLLSDKPFDTYDIIFCRNVMIYFDTKTRQKILTSLSGALKKGGYFFVGMSESLHGFQHDLSIVVPSGYRKK